MSFLLCFLMQFVAWFVAARRTQGFIGDRTTAVANYAALEELLGVAAVVVAVRSGSYDAVIGCAAGAWCGVQAERRTRGWTLVVVETARVLAFTAAALAVCWAFPSEEEPDE